MNVDMVDHRVMPLCHTNSIDEHGSKTLAGLHTLALLTSLLRIKT